jgi:nucleoside-diphosphate-sugar epimerase
VLRYGGFYGPGDEGFTRAVRKRQTPLVGDGHGVMSFVHLDDAEPAPMSDWVPVLARVLGAQPPRHFPTWAARLIVGPGLSMLTESRGSSNAKARGELVWQPRYSSWREGFAAAYGDHPAADSSMAG